MKSLIIFVLLIQTLACNQPENNKTELQNKEVAIDKTNEHPLPELKRVDSIDANFFPNVEDQKVYTRISIVDKTLIDRIVNVDVCAAKLYSVPCEYDTKFFCYAKGEIVKTLYLATQSDSCKFIGYVKSGGVVIKTVLSDSSVQLIRKLKQKSRKP